MSDPKRVFSEQEVADIVQRAAKLQEESATSAKAYKPGVSRAELERAASEVGIAPEFLDLAIREKLSGSQPRPFFGLAQPAERVVEGEIDPQDFDLILENIRVWSSRRAPVTQVGRTLHARAFTGSGAASIDVQSRNGRTRIRVKPFPVFEILGTFYPAFLATMMAAGPLAAAGHGIEAAAVGIGSFLAALGGFAFWSRKSNQAASRLAEKIQSNIADQLTTAETSETPQAESMEEDLANRLKLGE